MTRVHLHLCYISLYNHKLELNRLLYFWCLVWAADHDHTNKLYYNNIQIGEMKVARMDIQDIRSVFTMYISKSCKFLFRVISTRFHQSEARYGQKCSKERHVPTGLVKSWV